MNIQKIMQEAQKFQKKIKDFESKEFEHNYKNLVSLTVTGSFKIKNLKIDSSIIDSSDPDTLQDILIEAINEAKQIVDNERSKIENSLSAGSKGFF